MPGATASSCRCRDGPSPASRHGIGRRSRRGLDAPGGSKSWSWRAWAGRVISMKCGVIARCGDDSRRYIGVDRPVSRCWPSGSHHVETPSRERRSPIATTEPVIMELLAGTRSRSDGSRLRARLLALPRLSVRGLADFESAADLYRTCRGRGATVRKLIDCLIAAVAIRESATVLHNDRDFDVLAQHTRLRIERHRTLRSVSKGRS